MGRSSRRRILYWLGLLCILFAVVVIDATATFAWARAGGGGGYGGGGSSSSGGGGGGGGGEIIEALIWLCIRHPRIGIPLTITLAIMFYFASKEAKTQHAGHVIRRGLSAEEQQVKQLALQRLQSSDPNFNEDDFTNRVSDAFVKIQYAWSEQNLSSVRPFISDGIHERFSLQIDMQKADGIRNKMEDVRVTDVKLVAITSATHFDTIHVQINASAIDYNVSLESGRKINHSTRPTRFTEYWSFQRRQGAKTYTRPGVIEGNCPQCASPLEITDRTDCRACGAHVNSGQHDWVLSEITQAIEWRSPTVQQTRPGIAELSQRDPGFSLQHIEDRASVIFWRLRAAEFHNDPGIATPIVSPEMKEEFQRQLKELQARNEFWKDPAVGIVEVIDCIDEDNGRDTLRVKVKWSGVHSRKQKNGRPKTLRSKSIYTQVFVLVRNRGVTTSEANTFSAASCSNCGAPIGISKQGACNFCGTVLTDGTLDWVLDDIRPYTSDMAFRNFADFADRVESTQEHVVDLSRDEDSEVALGALVRVMAIDGHLDERERTALIKIGGKRGLSESEVDTIIESSNSQRASLPKPETAREVQQHLAQLVHAVMADGRVSSQERKLLSNYAERVELSTADVNIALAKERRRMYREAKRVLNLKPAKSNQQTL